MSARELVAGAAIAVASGCGLVLAVDAITGNRSAVATARWTVQRVGWANWQTFIALDGETAGPRFWTRRAAVAYATERWPNGATP
jgi:hypothetical protein